MRALNIGDGPAALLRGLLTWSDRRRFQPARADYYEYLSALMEGTKGRHTLRDIFERDARRYLGTVRGRLSHSWSRTYPAVGGDLYATWFGCFPASELAVIRMAQISGNEALVHSLRDLSHALGLLKRSRHILWTTLWSGVLSLAVLVTTVLAVPLFTVPRLEQLFGALPPEYLARSTRALIAFSAAVETGWGWVVALCLAGAIAVFWSFPNFVGMPRDFLDKFSIWRIYRCIGALRFMSVLTVLLQRQKVSSTQLRTALALMCAGSSAWMRRHLDDMLGRIDHGLVGADTFDTGLLDRELYWYLHDMVEARGLVPGLMLVRDRIDSHVLTQVAGQAQVLRWSLLAACVSAMLGLGLWHYVVIDELRRSLMIFHASL